jgi:hypothetical protein
MKPFSELSRRERLIEVVRWICFLPAALLSARVAQLVGGLLFLMQRPSWQQAGDTTVVSYWVQAVLYYVVPEVLVVFVGAKVAPRRQREVAIGLASVAILLSLVKHIVGQYVAGNQVGLVNFLHFGLETFGALTGMFMAFATSRRVDQSQEK